jgi:hypothetical protein
MADLFVSAVAQLFDFFAFTDFRFNNSKAKKQWAAVRWPQKA